MISGAAAKKLRLARRVTVAKGSKKVRAAGTVRVKMRFTKKARRRLRRARVAKLLLAARFKEAVGGSRRLSAKLTLRR